MSETLYVAVVDDDEGVCRSLSRLFRAAGFQVVSYLSAEAFLADTKQPKFDCLVLDVQLGGLSGIELAEQLASSRQSTPVVFITAHDELDVRVRALKVPRATYFTKTEPAEAVLAAIRRAVESNAADLPAASATGSDPRP